MAGREPSSKPSARDAPELYSVYLKNLQEGEPIDFEEFCARHPDGAEDLRKLHAGFRLGQSLVTSRSFHQSIRARLGDDIGEVTFSLGGSFMSEIAAAVGRGSSAPVVEGGRYVVQDEIARGGMGVVYKVRDRDLNRTLAMKVILGKQEKEEQGTADRTGLARFLEEAQVTAQLDHPGVVAVHEVGFDAAGQVYFTMPLVKGRELGEIFKLARAEEDDWNLPRAVGVLIKVCQTLGYAHAKGVVHRDLKPSNIMAGRFGEVYVMDWGLAKITGKKDLHDIRIRAGTEQIFKSVESDQRTPTAGSEEPPLVTMDGSVVGTPAYMGPEQARGRVEEVEQASDVYSLGAILYTLLTGRAPYVEPGDRVSPRTILGLVTQMPPKRIHEIDPHASPELVAICEKAMAREKKERYASSLDLAEDLQAWIDRRVVRAYRTGPAAELKSWVLRNRAAASIATVALCALLALAGWWTYREYLSSVDLRYRLARQYLRQGQSLCEQNRIDQGLHLFVRALRECPPSGLSLRSDIEMNLISWGERCNRLLQRLDHESDLHGPGERCPAVAFSSIGDFVVSGGARDRTARIWSVASGDAVGRPMVHDGPVSRVFVTRDGQRIVTRAGRQIRLWSGVGAPIGDALTGDAAGGLAFHAAEALVAARTREGEVRVWSAENGRELWRWPGEFGQVSALRFTDDGTRLLVGYDDRSSPNGSETSFTVRIWSLGTGQSLADAISGSAGSVHDFSADGTLMAVIDEVNTVRLWSLEEARPFGLEMAHSRSGVDATFSPDGAILATRSGQFVRLWSTRHGAALFAPLVHDSAVLAFAFSPDGELIATGGKDHLVRMWSTDTGKPQGVTIRPGDTVASLDFSGDGARIALASAAGTVEVWSADVRPVPERVFPTRSRSVWGVDFSPDGGQVAVWTPSEVRLYSSSVADVIGKYPVSGWFGEVQFSPDGRYLIASDGSARGAWLLDLMGGSRVVLEHGTLVRTVTFSADGDLAATGGVRSGAKVWSAPAGKELAFFECPGVVEDLVFNRGGDLLVGACDDGVVRIWSLAGKREARPPLTLHTDAVLAAEISPDGRTLATGSRDASVRFWSTESWEPVGPVLKHPGWVEDLDFDPQGRLLVTACADREVRFWSLETGERIGPPVPHGHAVRVVAYDPGGSHVLTGVEGSAGAELWATPRQTAERLERPDLWVETLTGKRMYAEGVTSHLSPADWRTLRRELTALDGAAR